MQHIIIINMPINYVYCTMSTFTFPTLSTFADNPHTFYLSKVLNAGLLLIVEYFKILT